ncbi:MAG TPA: alpha/beta hydrolase [Gaiellaceae bacterium]|nr:alpha/beta hydrolase [Gaiellaceae bacterium]
MPIAANLSYDERGSGPAIVFVHGHPFNRRMWQPQLEGLADEFRVVAPDLPGYGESPVRGATISMRALADSVVELLDALEIATAVVVGLSMGGLVAMELGLGYPERVAGLVLAATTAAPVGPGEAEQRRAAAAEMEENGMLKTALEMGGRLFGPRARKDPALVGAVFEMMITTRPVGAAAALRGRAERPDYSSLLPALTVPALVIAGDEDDYAPAPIRNQLVGSLPEPQLLLLEDVGHLPNLEEPDVFNAALRAFASAAR